MTTSYSFLPLPSVLTDIMGPVAATVAFVTTGPLALFMGGVVLSWFYAIPWMSLFILSPMVGVRLYTIENREICKRAQKRMTYFSYMDGGMGPGGTEGGCGYGYSVGMGYVAHVDIRRSLNDDRIFSITMIATAAAFEYLTKDTTVYLTYGEEEDTEDENGNTIPNDLTKTQSQTQSQTQAQSKTQAPFITVCERTGSFTDPYYRRRKIPSTNMNPRPEQRGLLTTICAQFARTGHVVVYLHGPPGSGKSMMGPLLARELGATYCNSLRPWQQGNSLGELHADVGASDAHPLVLVFDEFDVALTRIHEGLVTEIGSKGPIHITDKSTWNRFLDDIGRGLYPYIILLLTSNKTPTMIQSMDPAYIRKGRVDIVMEMGG